MSPPTNTFRTSRSNGRRSGGGLAATMYLAPALLVFGTFLVLPVARTVWSSQLEWDGISTERRYVGLGNFATMIRRDPYFWNALRNTLLWGFLSVAFSIIIGLLLASLLDNRLRGRTLYRSVFFLPAVMSPVVISAVWARVYNPQVGLANQVLGYVGMDGKVWLGEKNLALMSTMIVAVWRWSGLYMIFYLAGLQNISTDILEAARIDGAGYIPMMRRIIVPLLRPTTALLILLGTISAMREFEIIKILTDGGPAHGTDLLSIRIFDEAFELFHAGYAAAISVVLLSLTALLALGALRHLNRVSRSET